MFPVRRIAASRCELLPLLLRAARGLWSSIASAHRLQPEGCALTVNRGTQFEPDFGCVCR